VNDNKTTSLGSFYAEVTSTTLVVGDCYHI
jgi:hypothetical protein